MDTETIGAALKRKLGPFPVWIWAIIGGIGVYFLRKRGYLGGLGASQGETFQPSQANATPPQSQVPLQPGESVYDPNTGALSTAPGGDGTGATGTDPSQSIDDLANAIAAGFTTHVTVDRTKPKKNTAGRGDNKPSHHKKPSRPTKRTARKKAGHHQTPGHKGTTKKNPPTHKERARSKATTRLVNGGRTAVNAGKGLTGHGHKNAPTSGSARVFKGSANPTVRQRPTVGMTRVTAPVQHPVASHAASPHKEAAKRIPPPPRPSAPAPRAMRPAAPAVRKPPPTPKKRGR